MGSIGRKNRSHHSAWPLTCKCESEIRKEVSLSPQLLNAEKRFGFERITRVDNTLLMAIQREWQDYPKDHVKLVLKTKILGNGELFTTKGQTNQRLGGHV